MEPATTESPPEASPAPAPGSATATTTAELLPDLPAPPSTLLGRSYTEIPSLTADAGAGPMLDDLMRRAVEGARNEGSGRAIAWGIAVALGALLALRVIFDDVLPKLLLVGAVGAVVVAVIAVVSHAVMESRRRRALLEVLTELSRMAPHDAAQRDRVTTQVESVIAALRAPSSLLSFLPPRKEE